MSPSDSPYAPPDEPSPGTWAEPRGEPVEEQPAQNSVRLPGLLTLLGIMLVILLGPYLLSRFRYADTRARIRAEVDAATDGLTQLKPNLGDLVLASRLVVKRTAPSVVSIHRSDYRGVQAEGSGVIVDEAGYIITNFHVVKNAAGLHVRLADGRTANAGLVGGDPKVDLAVLKIELPDLVAAEWGDSNELEVGDFVWALGSPFGLDQTVTMGIVSAKQRRANTGGGGDLKQRWNIYQEYLQTDVAVNPGNSGGPLVDMEGRLVGINTAIVGETFQGVSFAIPSQQVRDTYNKMRLYGWIERGYLGVGPKAVPDDVRHQMQLEPGEGVFLASVASLTPAAKAGIQRNDVITKWNDHFASDPFLLTQEIADTPIGSKAKVVLKRLVRNRPVELEVEVTVGAVPR